MTTTPSFGLLRRLLRRHSAAAYSTSTSTEKWLTLPPFDYAKDGAAVGRRISGRNGDEETTALKWVVKCCPEVPRSLIQKLFRLRQVRRESSVLPVSSDLDIQPHANQRKRVAAKDALNLGDRIFLPASVQVVPSKKPESTCNRIHKDEMDYLRSLELYRDSAIIVVNKPLGMPVQGGAGIKKSLDQLASTYLKYDFPEPPRLVHRLDRDSSGILVMGRTQTTATILHSIFREKTFGATDNDMDSKKRILQRRYWALVIGSPRRTKGLISAPLKKVIVDDGRSERITVAENTQMVSSQHAVTEYRVIQSCNQGFTWLELSPLTGRKHQLRVHCAEVLGTPIVGDYKYGRIAHKNWIFSNLERDSENEGSVLDKQPSLHLHCKEMVLPDINKALKHLELSSECDLSELESLELTAPLPSHMERSWKILCP